MKDHKSARNAYYAYQTTARGLLDSESLQEKFVKRHSWYRCLLKEFLPEDKEAVIIDIPCGYGSFLYFLREEGYTNIKGYDLDPEQIRLARLLRLPAFQGDVFDVFDQKETYSCITSLDFLEHISKDEALNFVKLCYENLISGGTLIVRTPCADGLLGAHDYHNDLTHQWAMTSTVLRHFLKMVGFESVIILDERPQPYSFTNYLRLLVYYPAKLLTNIWLTGLGITPPKVYSKSMWAVAQKDF
jgi:2-polyprenyl-3-methyl-5-hydroxy-6-metoxy-1,4-benzoquinol methylase